ncbi:hypothetical protein ACUOA8_00735, partial [Escherichia sp. SS-MK2]
MTQFAFVFPGQGSQTVGMLADMAASYPIVEETFAEASAALGQRPQVVAQRRRSFSKRFFDNWIARRHISLHADGSYGELLTLPNAD